MADIPKSINTSLELTKSLHEACFCWAAFPHYICGGSDEVTKVLVWTVKRECGLQSTPRRLASRRREESHRLKEKSRDRMTLSQLELSKSTNLVSVLWTFLKHKIVHTRQYDLSGSFLNIPRSSGPQACARMRSLHIYTDVRLQIRSVQIRKCRDKSPSAKLIH